MISATLAAALEARRSDFNARFRLAVQRYPQLEGAEALRFVGECFDPLICAVAQRAPTAVDAVLSAAYDCALQLAGQRLASKTEQFGTIASVWRELLPAAAAHVIERPGPVIAALSNAAHQLAGYPDAAGELWLLRMVVTAPLCASSQECLLVGQANAWFCGMAHYREGALATLRALPPSLAAVVIGIDERRLAATLQAMQADPWFDGEVPWRADKRRTQCVGGFRGFGGAFLQPPVVKSAPGGWLVQSAGEHWLLIADVFGATLHRIAANEWKATKHLTVEESHAQRRLEQRAQQMAAGAITSSALSLGPGAKPVAVACTFAHSHQIALFGLSSA